MKARTPEAMIEELDTLTQAITGLSSTLRSRIKSEAERAQLDSPLVSPLSIPNGFRRLTPGEKQLEEIKSEQRRLQEERVASRVAELSISAEKAKARRKSMSSADMPEGKEGNSSTPIREPSSRQSVPHTSGGYSATAVHFGKRHGEEIREQNVQSERRLPGKERSPVEANFSNHYLQASSQREEGKFIYDDRNITSRRSRDRRDDQEMMSRIS